MAVPLMAMVLVGYTNWFKNLPGIATLWLTLLFLLAMIPGAWLMWSWQITKWRLWSYRRVPDIAKLKSVAIDSGLIWPDGHFVERTEIRTSRDVEVLAGLEAASQSAASFRAPSKGPSAQP